jgi:hypothetical protein
LSLPRSYASMLSNGLSRRNLLKSVFASLSHFMGFLRHGWESLNNEFGLGRCASSTPPRAHYSMLPTSGYSSIGCSPAEPISASPDNLKGMGRSRYCPSRDLSSQRCCPGSGPRRVASKGSPFFNMVQAIISIFAASFTRIFVWIPRSPWRPSRSRL